MLASEDHSLSVLGAPALGGSRVDSQRGGGSGWVGARAVEQPNAEHGPRNDGKGSLLVRALRWTGNQGRGFSLVRFLGRQADSPRGDGQEQAGGLHFGEREQGGRRLDTQQPGAIHPQIYRASRHLPLTAGALISVLFLAGCASFEAGKIRLPGVAVNPVKDAGSPAQVATSEAGVSLVLPKGSRIVKREIKGMAYRPASKGQLEVKETPSQTITEIIPGDETTYTEKESTVAATTGTTDTSLAKHRVDAEESRPLLYAAIGAALAAGFFVWRAYPTPAMACGAASIVFFMAWKVSGLPEWFWAVGLACVVGGGAIYIAHERGLNAPKV